MKKFFLAAVLGICAASSARAGIYYDLRQSASSATMHLTGALYLDGGFGISISSGNLYLSPLSSSSANGIVFLGTNTFIHMNTSQLGGVENGGQGRNLFMGLNSGNLNSSKVSVAGAGNTAFGNYTLQLLSTNGAGVASGISNTAVGYAAMAQNTYGWQNAAFGANALQLNTGGTQNTAMGGAAMYNNTVGSSNTAFGNSVLYTNTTGGNNTGVGWASMGGGNVGIMTGSANTCVGSACMGAPTTGGNNTCVGYACLNAITTGVNNTAVGENALLSNATGYTNVALGMNDLQNNTYGVENTGTGYTTLQSNTYGNDNTANGLEALNLNTTGSQNTAVGVQALKGNTTGINNTAQGYLAGYTTNSANANVTGSSNTFVGYNAGPGTAARLNGATCIGANCVVNSSNTTVLGGPANNVVVPAGSTSTVLGAANYDVMVESIDVVGVSTATFGTVLVASTTYKVRYSLSVLGVVNTMYVGAVFNANTTLGNFYTTANGFTWSNASLSTGCASGYFVGLTPYPVYHALPVFGEFTIDATPGFPQTMLYGQGTEFDGADVKLANYQSGGLYTAGYPTSVGIIAENLSAGCLAPAVANYGTFTGHLELFREQLHH